MFVLKMPILMLFWIVWWAVRKTDEPAAPPADAVRVRPTTPAPALARPPPPPPPRPARRRRPAPAAARALGDGDLARARGALADRGDVGVPRAGRPGDGAARRG